jgi:hypothetical protein
LPGGRTERKREGEKEGKKERRKERRPDEQKRKRELSGQSRSVF